MGELFAGRYELVDPIGRGGVGAVWRAWDQRRRRYVAAKVLQQRDAHTLLRFVREQALRIDHPHVLAPASWAADDDKILFTMDLVRGGSLAHLIGDYGALPPRHVCVLLDQLLAGLTAVHAEDVIHRDIKPANILLEATGTGPPHLRLSDFGIAMRKGEPRLTETDYVVGTPGYFAPEQILGAEPDFPADLFATGLLALYLLTGQKPDAEALVERFLAQGVPDAPAEVPRPLWQVIAGLLQPDPAVRFRTATGARKALASAVDLLPESAEGEETVEVFDHLGPLPEGFGPDGPLRRRTGGTGPAAGPVAPRPPGAPGGPGPQGGRAYAEDSAPGDGGFPLAPPAHTGGATPPPPAAPPLPTTPATPPGSPATPPAAPLHPPGNRHAPPTPFVTAAERPPVFPGAAPAEPGPGYGYPGPPPARTVEPGPGWGSVPPGAVAAAGPPPPVDPAGFSQATTASARAEHPAGHTPSPHPTAHALSPQPTAHTPSPHPTAHPVYPHPAGPPGPLAGVPAPARRPGPPARVAVPVLLLAMVCYAVGIWALAGS
ncbi:serine/threonine-protein kinase [Streptomyces zingiberis]|uniref:non-specific serine/threonine protein kinase n=1 Tax=Streptomyces zingiberis TaxID=2053010 RepID=A0ABX1BNF1_9ACTN|nr:serine/threonine-protein kinase [Streptomyces zingiberis]NJP99249.1 protein kinase [Streptomyces zingiberis]